MDELLSRLEADPFPRAVRTQVHASVRGLVEQLRGSSKGGLQRPRGKLSLNTTTKAGTLGVLRDPRHRGTQVVDGELKVELARKDLVIELTLHELFTECSELKPQTLDRCERPGGREPDHRRPSALSMARR